MGVGRCLGGWVAGIALLGNNTHRIDCTDYQLLFTSRVKVWWVRIHSNSPYCAPELCSVNIFLKFLCDTESALSSGAQFVFHLPLLSFQTLYHTDYIVPRLFEPQQKGTNCCRFFQNFRFRGKNNSTMVEVLSRLKGFKALSSLPLPTAHINATVSDFPRRAPKSWLILTAQSCSEW